MIYAHRRILIKRQNSILSFYFVSSIKSLYTISLICFIKLWYRLTNSQFTLFDIHIRYHMYHSCLIIVTFSILNLWTAWNMMKCNTYFIHFTNFFYNKKIFILHKSASVCKICFIYVYRAGMKDFFNPHKISIKYI